MGGIERRLGITPGTPHRRLVLGLLPVMAVSGMVTLAAIAIGANESMLLASVTIFGTALILLAIAIPLSRIHQRAMDELLKAPWARWSLSQHEWERFAARAWADLRRDVRYTVLGVLVLGVVIGVIGTVFIGDLSVSGVMVGVQVTGAIALVGVVVGGVVLAVGWWQYGRPTRVVREIVIGPRGLVFRGRYCPLVGPGLRLESVAIEPGDPASISFTTCFTMGSVHRPAEMYRVPLPRACEAEANAIMERFREDLERRKVSAR